MKRLDEVIDAMERCIIHPCFDCKGCPYEDDDAEVGCRSDDMDADALHYLRTIEKTENLYHDAVTELSKWKVEDWKDRCLPLTWDELRTMEGKPIWVEFSYEDGQHFDSGWFLVGFVSESFCDVIGKLGTSRLVKNDYWQAYRKEKE